MTVSTFHVVSTLSAKALNSQFSSLLCEEMESEHQLLLFHTSVCWVFMGQSFCKTFELWHEIRQFMLTLWEPAYNIFVPRFQPKTSSLRLPYQHHSSSADYARELFKSLNGLASLLVCTRKKNFGWGVRIFCEWRHKWSNFWAILAHVTWPRAQLLGQSISLKFLLETRLESESFESLIDSLAFLIQKLWS